MQSYNFFIIVKSLKYSFYKKEGVSKYEFWRTLFRFVRVSQMQGAEDKADGSIHKYVTEAVSESNAADGLL